MIPKGAEYKYQEKGDSPSYYRIIADQINDGTLWLRPQYWSPDFECWKYSTQFPDMESFTKCPNIIEIKEDEE